METQLTTAGWIFIIFGWGVVSALTTYCLWKVLRIKK